MKRLSFINSTLIATVFFLAWPLITQAQTYFQDSQRGDVYAGFRKTGQYREKNEMMVYLGNISNYMSFPPGTQVTITNYTYQDLTNMCPDNLGNLQWSVFSYFEGSGESLTNSAGVFPDYTVWYTIPRTNANIQTSTFTRLSSTADSFLTSAMIGAGQGAATISSELGATNVYNNTVVVLEPISLDPNNLLTAFIGDSQNPALGDFGGSAINYSVENVTSNSFTSPAVSDFYCVVPNSAGRKVIVDPLSGQTTGNADYLGYFTLSPSGVMTFTRASATGAAPVAAFVSSVTNGFFPLSVVYTSQSTGSITNWVWNFGNGTIVTNSTGANESMIYTNPGNYTVSLTVSGPGGSSTATIANYVIASPAPTVDFSATKTSFTLSGSNLPIGLQYRILTTTNLALPLAEWQPISTNVFSATGTFSFASSTTNQASFFKLVSP